MPREGCPRWCAAALVAALCGAGHAEAPPGKEPAADTLPPPRKVTPADAASPGSLLGPDVLPIDLAGALRLAGVQNPEILLARERVVEAVALRQLAAAQLLPTLNAGTNFNSHTGPLQRSTGEILKVNRGALYVGLGANAVGAGTVTVPGVVWSGNVSETIGRILVARQVVRQREFASVAVRNDLLLEVARAYLELLRAEGRRAVAVRGRDEVREVARVTANFADPKIGKGRQADADRAATELEQRNAEVLQAESDVQTSSARLCHTRSGVGLQHLAILTILTSHTSTFSRVYLPVRPSSKLDAAADKCDDGLLTKATATSEPTSQRLASTIFSKSMAGRTYFVTLIFCRSVTENSTSFIRLQ